MQTLRYTNSLLLTMCILSVITIMILLFRDVITEDEVRNISKEVTVDVLNGYEFTIVE